MNARTFIRLCTAALFWFPAMAGAALEIKAKAVKTSSTKEEESWVIRMELANSSGAAAGPLVLQYRYSGHTEFEVDGKPIGALKSAEGSVSAAALPPGGKVTVDSRPMDVACSENNRPSGKALFRDIRVRAWQNGKLIGQFPKTISKEEDSAWALQPPAVPPGSEAGPGPWLLVTDGGVQFSGLSLGASAAQVFAMLQSHGPAKPLAKPEPFLSHPLRMTTTELPGCLFAFDAAKKLSAIEITDPSRAKLPGGLLLGKSTLGSFANALGPTEAVDPAPAGSSAAVRIKLGAATLTIRDRTEAPATAAAILLE